jgi:hypothetical protein
VLAGAPADSDRISPFPPFIPAPADTGRLLLVACRVQAFAAYESGRRVRWGPVSSGAESLPTTPSLYRANWKAVRHVSTVDTSWVMRWAINLDQTGGLALHEYALPGRPASHNCIRLCADDAQWLYAWIGMPAWSAGGASLVRDGTPVCIFGAYEFAAPAPWRRLPADSTACEITQAEITKALAKR